MDGVLALEVISNVASGECFFRCFDTSGCHTFSYNNNMKLCSLYPGCGGAPCLIDDISATTYVKECAQSINAGICLFVKSCIFCLLFKTFHLIVIDSFPRVEVRLCVLKTGWKG